MYSLFRRSVIPLSRNAGLRALCTQGVDTGTKEHIESLLKNKQVVVFMKGTPEKPMCGFSNAIVQMMAFHGVDKYDSYNVLDDEKLRQGKSLTLQCPPVLSPGSGTGMGRGPIMAMIPPNHAMQCQWGNATGRDLLSMCTRKPHPTPHPPPPLRYVTLEWTASK